MAIRTHHEDFRVDEQLEPAWLEALAARADAAHPHAAVRLSKSGLTTPDAAADLARTLRIRPGQVSWAGLKDRHAVTAQHVTLSVGHEAAPRLRALATGLEGRGWRARLIGWSAAPIDARAIRANEFELLLRGLTDAACAEVARRAALLTGADGELLLVNYYGEQRFGSARHGEGFAARALLQGDFLLAIRLLVGTPTRKDAGAARSLARACAAQWGNWSAIVAATPACAERAPFEALAAGAAPADAFARLPAFLRTMSIEAYQSWLWNDAAQRLASTCAGALRTPTEWGELVFPQGSAWSAGWAGLRAVLPAPGATAAEPWYTALADALAAQGLTMDRLVVPGAASPFFGAADRPFAVRTAGFRLDAPEPGPGGADVRVAFGLPRGAYATTVLRALGQ
jgi:tRNA pseudouridine13 synthase